MIIEFLQVLFLLLISHSVCDYPLQGDYMARAKNRNSKDGEGVWKMVLLSHALIHAGGVFLVTQSYTLSIFQAVSHYFIDLLKCDNRISCKADQYLHYLVMFIISIGYIL